MVSIQNLINNWLFFFSPSFIQGTVIYIFIVVENKIGETTESYLRKHFYGTLGAIKRNNYSIITSCAACSTSVIADFLIML